MKYPCARLLLFSKAPEPGKVKTRLGSKLGMDKAARIYEQFVNECLATCISANLCPVDIWCDPSPEHPFFQRCSKQFGTGLRQQMGGDIGLRMSQAIQNTLQYADHVILIGADCPSLSGADIDTALLALQQGCDVVLGPARDGGYYLIGMSHYYPELFMDIPWSTQAVLDATEQRMRQLQLQWQPLTVRRDIDTAEDYVAYKCTSKYSITGNIQKIT